ncbi:lipopolysaccharide assembly protein LapB [Geitlerinema sp. PCC 7407]|uniref:tetratricopeptide repeat protein n=1 Tax=Geitlerinema sp. PCC 7407 TaxID=1173025 RepID=UPI00123796EE|nr:tetratricopeptide repeat protein [Geitlerinema sp. PCC 7407]
MDKAMGRRKGQKLGYFALMLGWRSLMGALVLGLGWLPEVQAAEPTPGDRPDVIIEPRLGNPAEPTEPSPAPAPPTPSPAVRSLADVLPLCPGYSLADLTPEPAEVADEEDEDEDEEEEYAEEINPLDIEKNPPDPLLPNPKVTGPLSPQAQQRLRSDLDALNTCASALYRLGNLPTAFEVWFRELRLRRALGPFEEIIALSRVGEVAWLEGETKELRYITARLQEIETEARTANTLDDALLRTLGAAYQQVRKPDAAIAVYRQILERSRQTGDRLSEEAALNTIGQLQQGWFQYTAAAETYQELLQFVRAKADRPPQKADEVIVLRKLAYIYEQDKQFLQAIEISEQLAALYQTEANLTDLPTLRLKIAQYHEAAGQLAEAERNYQEAYALGQSLQQYARAGDALAGLGKLYRTHNALDTALQSYQVLLGVTRQTYDAYGTMEAYDQIGQIYREQKKYDQAIAAFQSGLTLAQQLKHQVDYFNQQIQRTTTAATGTPATPTPKPATPPAQPAQPEPRQTPPARPPASPSIEVPTRTLPTGLPGTVVDPLLSPP